MAVTEATRHRLYRRLEEVLGPEEASTMMDLVPPVGWADVATKADLEHLRAGIDERFDALEERFGLRLERDLASFEAAMLDRLNRHLYAMAGTIVSSLGLAVAAVKLL